MNPVQVAGELTRMASEIIAEKEAEPVKEETKANLVIQGEDEKAASLSEKRGFNEACDIVAALRKGNAMKTAAAAEEQILKSVPGLAPAQLATLIDNAGSTADDVTMFVAKNGIIIQEYLRLKDADEGAQKVLKAALSQLKQKGNFLIETKNRLLHFQGMLSAKLPGIVQMLLGPDDVKEGEKAGNLISAIAEKMGPQVAEGVSEIINATKEDLTHMAYVVQRVKVVNKTASVKEGMIKKAGIADIIVVIKDWLSGKMDAMTQRIMHFSGDIVRWLKGFIERTKIARKGLDKVNSALDEMEKALAAI